MDASHLLDKLHGLGMSLTIEGEMLRVEPARCLTDALRSEIKRLKPQLIALLQADEVPPALQEMPGLDYDTHLRLWIWRGSIVYTRGTEPAYRAWQRREQKKKAGHLNGANINGP